MKMVNSLVLKHFKNLIQFPIISKKKKKKDKDYISLYSTIASKTIDLTEKLYITR